MCVAQYPLNVCLKEMADGARWPERALTLGAVRLHVHYLRILSSSMLAQATDP